LLIFLLVFGYFVQILENSFYIL